MPGSESSSAAVAELMLILPVCSVSGVVEDPAPSGVTTVTLIFSEPVFRRHDAGSLQNVVQRRVLADCNRSLL